MWRLNLWSLILGLIAWILPVIILVRPGKIGAKACALLCAGSLSACAISLCMQIFYSDYLVKIEDWSALLDTSEAVARVSLLLLIVTIILNGIALWSVFGKKPQS